MSIDMARKLLLHNIAGTLDCRVPAVALGTGLGGK